MYIDYVTSKYGKDFINLYEKIVLELGIGVKARTGDFGSLRVGFNSLIPCQFNESIA